MTSDPERPRPFAGMSREEFVRVFGGVYESSPWIAERAWREGIDARTASAVAGSLREVVDSAGRAAQTDLLRAHPDLAGRLALRNELTPDSASEQSSAGLDQCSPEELAEFRELNERYTAAFGFPFILAVRGRDRADILAAFRSRVRNDVETEFREALRQVHRIARLRIDQAFEDNDGT